MAGQPGFFDVDERYAALSAAGDPLERLLKVFDFEIFRPVLDAALARDDRPWGGTDPPAVVFRYAPGRSQEHAKALLADDRGIVQCDGYAAYKALATGGM